jgi:sensor histidine kinase regulating citrate/malate metabolism
MGTALDNVTDACELLHGADGAAAPAVYCLIQSKKNMLFIRVTNPLPAPLCYKDGEIQSTKAESGHGLGLSALRRIAQKYNGEVDISDKDGLFSLAVMLFM